MRAIRSSTDECMEYAARLEGELVLTARVLVLHYRDGKKVQDIASMVEGMTPTQVRHTIKRYRFTDEG